MLPHYLTFDSYDAETTRALLARAAWLKEHQRAGKAHRPLVGKTLAMIFDKPSTRTRVSFEVGMYQLGGHALHLSSQTTQMGRGETLEDTARVLSRYVDAVLIRTFAQERLERMATTATIPIINGLTDASHPCQAMADLLTIHEAFGTLDDIKVAYVGDGNNVAHSWIEASMVLKFPLTIATPRGHEPMTAMVARVQAEGHTQIAMMEDPVEAVQGARVISTDTWISMGQEGEGAAEKLRAFTPYQVNRALVGKAAQDAIVLHCLPAHRGDEITDDVMDGPQSRIFDQAENRLHAQKAILEHVICPPSL